MNTTYKGGESGEREHPDPGSVLTVLIYKLGFLLPALNTYLPHTDRECHLCSTDKKNGVPCMTEC